MTQTTAGSLWIMDSDTVCREILNDNRTRKYQLLHPFWRGDNAATCECSALNLNPCTGAALTYGTTPALAGVAPWYSAGIAASDDFLGFIVDDVVGLDYSNFERTVNQRSGNGANATPARLAGREITFTLLATAVSEAGMRHGLDWLAIQLANIGGRCGYGRAVMRLYCPPGMDEDDGKVELREVTLRSGPEWTARHLEGAQCFVREVMFTLLAGDPCFYTNRVNCSTSASIQLPEIDLNQVLCVDESATVAQLLCGPIDPVLPLDPTSPCCEIPAVASLAVRAAQVTIQMISGTQGPFLIETWQGAAGADCDDVVANPANFVGRIAVGTLSGAQGVLVDASQQILWTRPTALSAWTPDDSLLLFPEGEFPYFPTLSGSLSMYVVIRPYNICNAGGSFVAGIQSESVFGCVV